MDHMTSPNLTKSLDEPNDFFTKTRITFNSIYSTYSGPYRIIKLSNTGRSQDHTQIKNKICYFRILFIFLVIFEFFS
jgi:hypothetical protein